MRNLSVLCTTARLLAVLASSHCLSAQAPSTLKEAPGLPPRSAPSDYQTHALAGTVTLAAEFTGHGIPNAESALYSDGYVAVEVGLFGRADARLTITATDFSLKLNGKKDLLPSQPWGLAAKEIKDPEWVPPEAASGSRSKGGISGSGGGDREPGAPPPLPPKPPVELLRNWQQRVKRAALAEGDRPLPQAGLIFFQYRGKVENIKSLELIYKGPAGNATLVLQ